ncbi:MAG: VOC family protein [Paracoccus sp. (in: a-proteobacteria)]|nr:VOC family protein [Paracoccus sp. (in: a-proteobacteria)]
MSNSAGKGPVPRGINHIGLTVPDLDAATDFLRAGLGALYCYDGLTRDDPPREGEEVERQLGLPKGARILRQRMLRIGNGPGLELFEIETDDSAPAPGLADKGWNHISLYCDDLPGVLARLVEAGGEPLSEIHGNSAHEDTPGNGSVYVRPPWGGLIELQTIPGGYRYGPDAEAEAWLPERDT